jgi:hypothetical protein
VVLGGLPVDATLSLYSGCSTLLATSSQGGLHWEEILRTLAPGTYGLRMSSVGGASSATSYTWRVQRLASPVALVSARSASSTSVRLVGEVVNTSSSTRAVTITARLYSASGVLLKTVSGAPLIKVLGPSGRSAFVLKTTRPAGFAKATYTISSTVAIRATRLLAVTGVTGSAPAAGQWHVAGTIANTSSTVATSVAWIAMAYDSSGTVLDATSGSLSPSTLAPGQQAPFGITFSGLPSVPQGTSARARAS